MFYPFCKMIEKRSIGNDCSVFLYIAKVMFPFIELTSVLSLILEKSYPNRSAASITLFLVAMLTPGLLFKAIDTAASDMPSFSQVLLL